MLTVTSLASAYLYTRLNLPSDSILLIVFTQGEPASERLVMAAFLKTEETHSTR